MSCERFGAPGRRNILETSRGFHFLSFSFSFASNPGLYDEWHVWMCFISGTDPVGKLRRCRYAANALSHDRSDLFKPRCPGRYIGGNIDRAGFWGPIPCSVADNG